MSEHDAEKLAARYLDGSITEAEKQELFDWYRRRSALPAEWPDDEAPETVRQRMFSAIQAKTAHRQHFRPRLAWYLSGAAAAVLLLSLFILLRQPATPGLPVSKIKAERYKNDVPSGGSQAILVLADGTEVVLNKEHNGYLATEGNVRVRKVAGGQLAYESAAGTGKTVAYNTIRTPRGGQYQVSLADGTKVWLNSASTLRFPTAFSGNRREVTLSGEAYFEVSKDKHKPFRVNARDMQVEVLGTQFNLSAYENEDHSAAVLVEGAVRVLAGGQAMLKPGEQASFNRKHGRLETGAADTEQATAWKNGYFLFANQDIRQIMEQISRWYDVEVIYRGDVSHRAIWATVSRSANISEVLHKLEMSGLVRFEIEGRRVTVMP
ncbi:anti-sigma factor [Pedobacter yulinensis]|uniref:Anti-sigma factor n=1 Tax=Pedobacter yulinensis TaxID=2126353 RepID=A0A2T3HHC0_9SPHI|nr:FecR family protein [Pedobacter yulinensis]PST81830.1 anti-sigma factor [Pedobacter yulinensis]